MEVLMKRDAYEDLRNLFMASYPSKSSKYWIRFLRLEKQKEFKKEENRNKIKKG